MITTTNCTITGSYTIPNDTILTGTTTSDSIWVSTDPSYTSTSITYSVPAGMKKEEKKQEHHYPDDIIKVIEYVPNKVYKFIFHDKTEIKTVCDEEDEFDFDYAFYLAIAKKIYSKFFTLEGVMKKANELRTEKGTIKQVEKAKKQFYKEKEEKEKEEEKKRLEKEKKKKLIDKKRERKNRKKALEINKLYYTIKEAIENADKKE